MSLQFRRSSWLLASSALVLMTFMGCERLGFETETAPKPPETDAEAPAEPQPWENPPSDWTSPSTDLLVYEVGEDDEPAEETGEIPEQQSSETYHARIVVSKDAVHMENISALELRSKAEREQIAAAAKEAGLDGIWQFATLAYADGQIDDGDREGVFKLPAVSEYIGRIQALTGDEKTAPTVALDLHTASPYARIYSVAYSVWEAAPRAKMLVRARKDSRDGPIFTLADATMLPENLGECDPTQQPCARPSVEARKQGLQLRAQPGIPTAQIPDQDQARSEGDDPDEDAGEPSTTSFPCLPGQQAAREGELPRIESESDWTNRVMLLDEALCPSVPLADDGTYDAAGLVELFNDIESMAPGCNRASWTAGMQTTWETLGPAMGHAAAQTSFDQVQFERPLPKTTPAPACEDGMRPSPASDR
jgi:hypothetical protein